MTKTTFPGSAHAKIDATSQSFDSKFSPSIITPNVLVLHSTEGWDWPSYAGGEVAPNMTVKPDFANKRLLVRQHFPANHSSRALEHRAGTVATNTLNAFQIEIVGTCDAALSLRGPANHLFTADLPDWAIQGLAEIADWLHDGYGLKLQDAAPGRWIDYHSGTAAQKAAARFTDNEWINAYGICGHEHIPHNSHGDPGLFPIAKLVATANAIKGTTVPPVVTPPVVAPPVVKPPLVTKAVWGDPATWKIGATGVDVTRLGERLTLWAKALHLPAPYAVGPGPEFTDTDKAAVRAFQEAQGWSGADADGYPGATTFKILASTPLAPAPIPAPASKGLEVEYISANLAGYDVHRGLKNRVSRSKSLIPDYLGPKKPLWFHFQECAIDMFPNLDKQLPDYKRIAEGGKGRESYYRRDVGIKILQAKLLNVKHMLLKDTKEHLVIAWEKDGYRGVYCNFHNENEGSTYQIVQLRDVMNAARDMADAHGIPRANIFVTGDSNTKAAAAYARAQGWSEAIYSARKRIDLQWRSTNAWVSRLVLDRRIDVDVFQKDAVVLEAEQLYGKVIADHWPHRVLHLLVKG